MSDIHALSGAYAVDAVDGVERKLFEQHLANCPDCRREVDSLREASSLLPEATAVAPPPDLRARVLADIATVRPLPPLTAPVQPRESADSRESQGTVTSLESRRRRFPAMVAAAASVAALLGAGAVIVQPWEDSTSQQELTAAERILTAPDAQEVEHTFPDGSSATVVRSVSVGEAVIVTSDMASAPSGKVFQLWLQDPSGEMIPAGLMEDGGDNTVILAGDAAQATGVGITIEPEGGSEEPTPGKTVAYFEFEEAV